MKVISKKISRNEFVSRKNGVIPSLMDMWIVPSVPYDCSSNSTAKKYVYSTYSSAVQKANELGMSSSMIEYKGDFVYQDHNYGLVVSDIIIPQSISTAITDYTDVYVNIPDENGGYYDLSNPILSTDPHYERDKYGNLTRKIISGGTEVKILTYATLNKWYTFFREYKHTIYPYNTAIDYYNNRYEAKNDVNKKRFEDLDTLFIARGGDGMYNWIIDNCMPHDENKDVKNTFEYSTNSASYVIPILFTNSIDDLGEMTIFSSKWKDGVDYSDTLDKLDTDNVSDRATPYSGSTVIYQPYYKDNDGDVITIQEAYVLSGITNKGYEQNGYYENVFVENQWANYTDYMIASGNSEFASYSGNIFDTRDHFEEVTTYAFSPVNGNVIYNPQPGTCENDLSGYNESETIDYIAKRFVVINDELIDVINGDYVVPNYDSSCLADLALKTGKAIPVIKDGPLKYAELNGKRFYAVKEGNKYYIYFLNSLCCNDIKSEVIEDKDYIIYDNNLFVVSGNTVEIGKEIYKEIYEVWCGYFVYNGMTYFIDCTPKVLIDDDTKRKLGWASVSVNGNETVTICHKLDVKQANIVSGYTESKLELLRRRKVNTDELGNELPGFIDFDFSNELTGVSANLLYDLVTGEDCEGNITAQFISSDKLKGYGTMYNTAYDRCTLDLLYVPGQFSDLEYQKTLDGGKILFNGNYLKSIEFYHLNEWGEKIDSGETVTDSRPILKEYFNGGSKYDPNLPVYCDITYYIGATIEYDGNEYKPSSGRHEGVKYVETFTVNKLIGSFFMSDNTTFPFFYYELRSNKSGEELDDFNDVKLVNLSYFEMVIMTFGLSEGTRTSDDTFNEDYWVKNNGMITSPVFRSEYNLFSSTPQKEDDNIYIDRGISAAFESHLKLLETHTLESLENYSNGYFKINEY